MRVTFQGLVLLVASLLSQGGLEAQIRNSNVPPAIGPATAPVKEEAPKVNPGASEVSSGTGLAIDVKTYVIGPEDILFIRVWREDTLSGQYGVRPDGKITMPLVKDIQAAGLTPQRLGDQVTQSLMEYINKPDVTVTVLQVNSKKYFITGEVNRPGQYPLVTPVTIFEALNGAGGFRDFANRKDIVIARGKNRIKFNYLEILKGKKLEQNIQVESGDTIIVK